MCEYMNCSLRPDANKDLISTCKQASWNTVHVSLTLASLWNILSRNQDAWTRRTSLNVFRDSHSSRSWSFDRRLHLSEPKKLHNKKLTQVQLPLCSTCTKLKTQALCSHVQTIYTYRNTHYQEQRAHLKHNILINNLNNTILYIRLNSVQTTVRPPLRALKLLRPFTSSSFILMSHALPFFFSSLKHTCSCSLSCHYVFELDCILFCSLGFRSEAE